MESLFQDLRYRARMLLKSPGFTVVAVLTLALGIGANSAIFSIINAVLLRPLPLTDPDKLVLVWETNSKDRRDSVAFLNFKDWEEQNRVFENIAASTSQTFNLSFGDEPERIYGLRASVGLLPLLKIGPQLGRNFLPEEQQAGKDHVVLVSHSLWQRRFAGDSSLLDRSINLNGEPYRVIGILPAGFEYPPWWANFKADLFVPMTPNPNRRNHSLRVIARLKEGTTVAQAQAEMDVIAASLEKQYPESNKETGVNIIPLHEEVVGGLRSILLFFLAAVGFVLLIACANVTNLLLARATARQKEIAIRAALGASRLHIVRQLLTESLMLALIGGSLGVLVNLWGTDTLISLSPKDVPRLGESSLDLTVLVFTLFISLLTGIIFGLVPALQASKPNLNETLKEGGRSPAGSLRHNRIRNILVVAEISLSLVLLVGAGLMIKSFVKLQQVDPGIRPDNILSMSITLPKPRYPEKKDQWVFFQRVLQQVESLPGVLSAGFVNALPFSGSNESQGFIIEGQPRSPSEPMKIADFRIINSGYMKTMGIPLLKGRLFTESDREGSQKVVLINQTMALRFWPGEDPIGKRIAFDGKKENPNWREIVGIVGDVYHWGLDKEKRQEMYFPYLQVIESSLTLLIRTEADPMSLVSAARSAIWSVDRDQPVTDIRTMEEVVSDSVAPRRFIMLLLAIFAAVAMILATAGIYGVMSYAVTQRTREIGIRMALGAQQLDVLKLIVGQGMILTLIGITIGLIAAIILSKFITSLLFNVSPTDSSTFAVISFLLSFVALLASYIPARRATRVDPMVVLRYE